MRVLVIGGTGFIGPHVVSRLLQLGHEVSLFHRGTKEGREPERAGHVYGQRERLPEFRDRFESFEPEVVVDMFPYFEEDALAVNKAFKGIAKRLVAVSSMDVYRAYGKIAGIESGPPESGPFEEDAPLRQELYPYRGKIEGMDDYEKILVERVVMREGELPGTVLRLPMVYGPGDYQHRFYAFLKPMLDHRPALLMDEGLANVRLSFGHVEDVTEAIALAVCDERAADRIYNVGERDAITQAEWARLIGESVGWDGEIVEVPSEQLPAHLHTGLCTDQDLVADTGRIRRELGYEESVSRQQRVRQSVAWEQANPPEVDPERFDYAKEDEVLTRLGCSAQKKSD